MSTIAALVLLLQASTPSLAGSATATASAPAAPVAASPCGLLNVQANTGPETFLACTQVSIRLSPDRTWQMAWNATLQQVLAVGQGPRDDNAILVSNGESGNPLVEDLTVDLVAAAQANAPKLGITSVKIKDFSQFASTGAMTLGSLNPPRSAAQLGSDLPVTIQAPSDTATRIAVAASATPATGQ